MDCLLSGPDETLAGQGRCVNDSLLGTWGLRLKMAKMPEIAENSCKKLSSGSAGCFLDYGYFFEDSNINVTQGHP